MRSAEGELRRAEERREESACSCRDNARIHVCKRERVQYSCGAGAFPLANTRVVASSLMLMLKTGARAHLVRSSYGKLSTDAYEYMYCTILYAIVKYTIFSTVSRVQYDACIVRRGDCCAENAFPVERRGARRSARKLSGLYARADPLGSSLMSDDSDSDCDLRTAAALLASPLKSACTTPTRLSL